LQFSLSQIPFLDGAKDYASQWLFPGGSARNQQFYKQSVEFAPGVSEEMQQLLFTPETSGGLLIAFPRHKADLLKELFSEANHPFWIVGEVCKGKGLRVS
jgi:selenide,water dikinase